uniref:Uncharacterized protein n=1 Tax=Branchiostoma floridae TaxID=7739 RepID=C3Y8P1_BRAFL|eukprot:XP_002607468.1 hypothetical protein BRAFLDRAFT_69900 [Branchiostoma floridae]
MTNPASSLLTCRVRRALSTSRERKAGHTYPTLGQNIRYSQLSSRVNTVFNQFRYVATNMQRRNSVYVGLAGLLTYGLQRAPGGTFYVFSPEILQIVRETYPSGDDVAWMLTNRNNRPTKEVGVDDLFEDKGKN